MLLLVEDEPLVRRAFCQKIGGRAVVCAGSATEARDLALLEPYLSGIFVDPGLPEGPTAGLELLEWLVAHDPRAERVILTGRPVDAEATGLRLGAVVLEKPLDPARFAAVLARCDANMELRNRLVFLLDGAAARYKLTPREVGLLVHVASGRRSASYAKETGIARTTANAYRKGIQDKTCAPSVEIFLLRLFGEDLQRR